MKNFLSLKLKYFLRHKLQKEREKLMIFYFTGTGNSLWAAKEIGKELNQPVENIIKQKAIFSAKTI